MESLPEKLQIRVRGGHIYLSPEGKSNKKGKGDKDDLSVQSWRPGR